MKELNVGGIINHCTAVANMIAEEKECDRKHAQNARCKAGNYSRIAGYIEYAFGVSCSTAEVEKLVK